MSLLKDLKHVAPKGEGYFCTVTQYVDEETGANYALKELKKSHYPKEDYRYRMSREIQLLEELQGCENIIRLIDHGNDKDKEKLWYLMPFARYNLFQYIRSHNSTLSLEQRFDIATQVINAIKYSHKKNILHRDISPNNVMVFLKGGNPVIKVCDFGLGKDSESLSYYTGSSASGYGQILYVSPEQRIKLKDATIKSDIYSLGKLIYFIFTGKDPDNLKPFPLSTLVTKATEDNPEERFKDIDELETHFNALRELLLNQKVPIEYITLKEVLESNEEFDLQQLHQLLVKGNTVDHVYHDYVAPVNKYFLKPASLKDYYKAVGNSIREFVQTYDERLNECYQTVRWPFSEMNSFGEMLKKMIVTINDDQSRLICLKHLWKLAFENDQWSVQKDVKEVYTEKYITRSIETQLAEYIVNAEVQVDLTQFSNSVLPKVIKLAIITANGIAEERAEARKQKRKEESNFFEY